MTLRTDSSSPRLVLFYVILVYVFAFMFWWTFLLLRQNAQHVEDIIARETAELRLAAGDPALDLPAERTESIRSEFRRNRIMILTEGSVFFIILFLGLVRIRRSWLQEIRLNRQQSNFVLSVTHELKSPLSTIKLVGETLRKRDLDPEHKQRLVTSALDETERLETLIENILMAARLEDRGFGLEMGRVDLRRSMEELHARYEAFDPPVRVELPDDAVFVTGDGNALDLVVGNLVENALKYAPGGPVDVRLERTDGRARITVRDHGPGIPAEERDRIFQKFYRLGSEETRRAKGTGLGLFIVQRLVRRHKGTIAVSDAPGGGALFRIDLPLN